MTLTVQGEQCLKEAENLLKKNPDLLSCVLICVAQHVKDKNLDKGIALLQVSFAHLRSILRFLCYVFA